MTDHPNPLPLLPEGDHLCGDGWPEHAYTAEQMQAYARANMAPLAAEVERLRARCERVEALAARWLASKRQRDMIAAGELLAALREESK